LKERRSNVRIICVEPQPAELIEGLHTLEGFWPGVYDEAMVDERIVVSAAAAFAATRQIAELEGLFAGASAGAVLDAARQAAEACERGNFVLLMGDGGWKYLSTGLWTSKREQAR
jgi:cysteine synthase B